MLFVCEIVGSFGSVSAVEVVAVVGSCNGYDWDWSFDSSRNISSTFSALSFSSYHCRQRSKAFWSPSKTHTVSADHSTPFTDMNVRRMDPKRLESAPKGPMYLDKSWSCGGDDSGYVSGIETRILTDISSCGDGRLGAGFHYPSFFRMNQFFGCVLRLTLTQLRNALFHHCYWETVFLGLKVDAIGERRHLRRWIEEL